MRLAILSCIAMLSTATAAPKKNTAAKDAPPPRYTTLPAPPEMPKPTDSGFVDSDGAKIYFARHGNAKGTPVILLHGGMGNGEHWSAQMPALTDKHHVIAIDSRGQGRSTRPKKSKAKPTYDALAADVIAVMDHLKLEKASIVGWSDGGEIALKLAIHHPTRVAKIVVLGANYDIKGAKKRGSKGSRTFALYAAKCRMDYARLSTTPKEYDKAASWLAPIWRSPMGFTKEQLKGITAPALIADGDHDEIIELAQVKEMAKLIPNARLEIFSDASHFVMWQDPASVNKVLVDFLAP